MSVALTKAADVSSNDIYALLQNVLEKNIEIQNQIKENREEIKRDLTEVKEIFHKQLEDLHEENKKLKEEIAELNKKLNNTERKIKKYNIVIYGLKDRNNAIEDFQEVLKLFTEVLEINCIFDNFRDIHRIGRYIEDKNRPIVVEVLIYRLKSEILSSSAKLKGTGIYITQEYSTFDYNRRKILVNNLKSARNLNLEARIHNNQLIIEKVKYSIEDLEKGIPEKLQKAQKNVEQSVENSSIKPIQESGKQGKSEPTRNQDNLPQEKVYKRPTRLNNKHIG